ncbi:hypothetical protein J2Z62_000453 [Mycoplasmoides fastidiosum]|uniref:Lipoprotein n=1 Tax=Mycoplasmoides fastidiosum TaxID=92758 RepID=A0ABU0LZ90_9BACT|nr:hypothetical protein [Mycoplasmoides fastidiosum]MDQ0514015.1 hypothetical protein [Mycoplasmoides fastidiosum]UUD37574.1 hypothetical protein NPA10_03335 [Mycoplasmoides fastidiosum]
MNKLKLHKLSRKWLILSGLVIGANFVLAACARLPQTTITGPVQPQQLQDPVDNEPLVLPPPPLALQPDDQVPSVTTEQIQAVKTLLQEHIVRKVFADNVIKLAGQTDTTNSKEGYIRQQLKVVGQVGELNNNDVNGSINTLGRPDDAASSTANSSILALLKFLINQAKNNTAQPTTSATLTKLHTLTRSFVRALDRLPKKLTTV